MGKDARIERKNLAIVRFNPFVWVLSSVGIEPKQLIQKLDAYTNAIAYVRL
jgi:hypothetical protein